MLAMSAAEPWPVAGLPSEVLVYEVGPRDGLRNEPSAVPVEVKAKFIERLVDVGVRAIELTSFVRAARTPPLADASALLHRLSLPDHVRAVVLEQFRFRDESIARFEAAVALARANALAVRG